MSNSLVLFISLIFHSEACAPDTAPASLLRLKSRYWAGIRWGEEEKVAVASLLASLPVSLSASPHSIPVSISVSITPQHPCQHPCRSYQLPQATLQAAGEWLLWINVVFFPPQTSRRKRWRERVKREVLVCKWNLRQAGVERSCFAALLSAQDKFPAWPLRPRCVGLGK